MEQVPNSYITPELCFQFRYFAIRKFHFVLRAMALVVFPGGFGTLDELTEILTLAQTRKLERPIPVILYGTDYWREILNFDALVRHGMIDRKDLGLFQAADDPAQALGLLQRALPAEPEGGTPSFAHSRTRESQRANSTQMSSCADSPTSG
jgi:hypothetical protein